MHIKRMHEMIEKLTECASSQLAKGTDCVDAEEMEKVACIIKDLSEAEYYSKITKAMDESTSEESMRYYDNYRYRNGRYAPKGRGRYMPERAYNEPYRMDMDMWDEEPGELRERDRLAGIHYYTDNGNNGNNSNSGNNGNYQQSRVDRAIRHYSEKHDMASLEELMNSIHEKIIEENSMMDTGQKNMVKSKLTNLINNIK